MISFSRTNRSRRAAASLTLAAAAFTVPFALTGCAPTPPTAQAPAGAEQTADTVTIGDAWVKATNPDEALGHAMTGVFGTLQNPTSGDLTIESVSSDAAGVVELHEVVDGQMRKIEGDVTIPAGGTYELAPGANHIMLMELRSELLPGDEVSVTLTFSDGSTLDFVALVKDTSGANESYADLDDADVDDTDPDTGSHG